VEEVEVLDAIHTAARVPAAHVRPATQALASTLEFARLALLAVPLVLTTSVGHATQATP
jgi:alkaline phosphatase